MEEVRVSPSYHMGNTTMEVPIALFVENRRRLLDELINVAPNSVAFFEGGTGIYHYDTDTEYLFRQEPFFHWLFGVTEPDFFGMVDITSKKSYLFYPKPSQEHTIWIGKLPSQEEFLHKYLVDEVLFIDDIFSTLSNLKRDSILVLKGTNTDSKLNFTPPRIPNIEFFNVDYTTLHPIMIELRVIKTPLELQLMRYATKITIEAHKYVMANLKPEMHEYQGEALFKFYIYHRGGCRAVAYTCICGSGPNCAILHYGHATKPNDKKLLPGDLCLFDMGASYYGYASDVTVTFPINKTFTDKQTVIYSSVLNARAEVYKNLKPGAFWSDLHTFAIKALLSTLKDAGLLRSSVDKMMEAGLGFLFQPHGLGHLLGIDVHDVGGYTDKTPGRPKNAWANSLRTARQLKPGMVITVEPGCYFIDDVLDAAFKDPKYQCFLADEINNFRGSGGVRIEDVVVITENGYEILSKNLPRTIEEIEKFMEAASEIEPVIPQPLHFFNFIKSSAQTS